MPLAFENRPITPMVMRHAAALNRVATRFVQNRTLTIANDRSPEGQPFDHM
jgi:hypothetical protein